MENWIAPPFFVALTLALGAFFVVWRKRKMMIPGERATAKEVEVLNPIRNLKFDDFLDPEQFVAAVHSETASWLNANAAMLSAQTSNIAELQGVVLARFSPETAEKIAQGTAKLMETAAGTQLSAISEGRILENAHKVDPSKLMRVTQFLPLLVGSAHIVAGYDNAKRLARIEEKIDRLVRYRKSEQLADLKTIFEEVQRHPLESGVLRTQISALRRLRNKAFGDLLGELNSVRPFRELSLLKQKFKSKRPIEEVANCLGQIPVLRAIVQLEQIAYLLIGESAGYLENERPQTVHELEKIGQIVKSKVAGLEGSSVDALSELVPTLIGTLHIDQKKAA